MFLKWQSVEGKAPQVASVSVWPVEQNVMSPTMVWPALNHRCLSLEIRGLKPSFLAKFIPHFFAI